MKSNEVSSTVWHWPVPCRFSSKLRKNLLEVTKCQKPLRSFGSEGEKAAMKELHQHHDMEVCKPKHAAELTQAEKDATMESLMFLQEKRTGEIEAPVHADDSKQRLQEGMR